MINENSRFGFYFQNPSSQTVKTKNKNPTTFWGDQHVPGISETQKTAFRSQLSLSTMWGPGPELWLSGLVARLVAQP